MADIDLTGDDSWVRGQDEEFAISVTDSAGDPEDLTGALVEFEIKKGDGDDDPPVLHLDSDGHGLSMRAQSGADVGWLDGIARAASTTAIASGAYKYDVFVTLPGMSLRKRSHHGRIKLVDTPNQP